MNGPVSFFLNIFFEQLNRNNFSTFILGAMIWGRDVTGFGDDEKNIPCEVEETKQKSSE